MENGDLLIRLERLIIAPRFDGWGNSSFNFSEGLASVSVNRKFGFVDKAGELVISPQYDSADGFSEGLAAVEINGKWGYIDKAGTMVIAPQFNYGHAFSEGLAGIELRNDTGSFKYGFIDKNGTMVIPAQFDSAQGGFSEGIAAVAVKESNGSWSYKGGFIDHQGQWVISPDALSGLMEKYVALEEQKKVKAVADFRKTLSGGEETNCGPVIEVKGKLVKVAFPVANYGNEHWIRRDEIYPSGYNCRFINGQYQSPGHN